MGKISITNQKEFTLNKVRFKKDGGLSIAFQLETEGAAGITIVECTLDCDDQAHPDLMQLLDKMKEPIVMTANGFNATNVIFDKKLIIDAKLKPAAIDTLKNEIRQQAFDDTRITGVTFYHLDEGFKVCITGGFESSLGYAAINTPAIGFKEIKHDFQEELEKTLKTLQTEVFKYIAEKKRAQLEIFDKEDKAA